MGIHRLTWVYMGQLINDGRANELMALSNALIAPVQFGHDDGLCLVGCGAGGEVDHIGQPPVGEMGVAVSTAPWEARSHPTAIMHPSSPDTVLTFPWVAAPGSC